MKHEAGLREHLVLLAGLPQLLERFHDVEHLLDAGGGLGVSGSSGGGEGVRDAHLQG